MFIEFVLQFATKYLLIKMGVAMVKEKLTILFKLLSVPIIFTMTLIDLPCQAFNSCKPVEIVNSEYDEKAIAFRFIDSVTIETWITSSNFAFTSNSKVLLTKLPKQNLHLLSLQEINPTPQKNELSYNGHITFLNSDIFSTSKYFVFVSNRTVDGKFYGNDLYEGTFTTSGSVSVKRLNNISTPHWDDTPCLHPNGHFLYFSSDRLNPGSGKSDIFIAKKIGNEWVEPMLLPIINTSEYSETTPFVSHDGKYLFYSTNFMGDFDIWIVQLDENGLPIGKPEPLDEQRFPGVNLKGSDEISPTISPAGNYFFFASNRKFGTKTQKDFDIYQVNISKGEHKILVDFKKQKMSFVPSKEMYTSSLEITSADVSIYSLVSNFSKKMSTDENGLIEFNLERAISPDPLNDFRYRAIRLEISSPCDIQNIVRTEHKLKFDALCNGPFTHNVRIWCEDIPPDTIPLPIDSIPFFITGYWCPSTIKYKDYTLCGSIANIIVRPEINLTDTARNCSCFNIRERLNFTVSRSSDEFFFYSVEPKQVLPKIVQSRTNNLCIKLNEIDKAMNYWSKLVDSTLDEMVIQMKKILSYDFVKNEINRGGTIKLEVFGWTDWRPLDFQCRYTGSTIDLNNSFIEIPTKAKLYGKFVSKNYIRDGLIKKGERFVGQWASGNQLLSDLRAYYTADLLDKLWSENIPEYNLLKEQGILKVVAIGRSVKNLPGALEYNRSVDVRFVLERAEPFKEQFRRRELNPNVDIWLCPIFEYEKIVKDF